MYMYTILKSSEYSSLSNQLLNTDPNNKTAQSHTTEESSYNNKAC